MASITISAKSRYPENLKEKNEEQLVEWSKANKEHWLKIKSAIGATETDTLDELADVAPEDYEEKFTSLPRRTSSSPWGSPKFSNW